MSKERIGPAGCLIVALFTMVAVTIIMQGVTLHEVRTDSNLCKPNTGFVDPNIKVTGPSSAGPSQIIEPNVPEPTVTNATTLPNSVLRAVLVDKLNLSSFVFTSEKCKNPADCCNPAAPCQEQLMLKQMSNDPTLTDKHIAESADGPTFGSTARECVDGPEAFCDSHYGQCDLRGKAIFRMHKFCKTTCNTCPTQLLKPDNKFINPFFKWTGKLSDKIICPADKVQGRPRYIVDFRIRNNDNSMNKMTGIDFAGMTGIEARCAYFGETDVSPTLSLPTIKFETDAYVPYDNGRWQTWKEWATQNSDFPTSNVNDGFSGFSSRSDAQIQSVFNADNWKIWGFQFDPTGLTSVRLYLKQNIHSEYLSSNDGRHGAWGTKKLCDPHQKICGFQVKHQEKRYPNTINHVGIWWIDFVCCDVVQYEYQGKWQLTTPIVSRKSTLNKQQCLDARRSSTFEFGFRQSLSTTATADMSIPTPKVEIGAGVSTTAEVGANQNWKDEVMEGTKKCLSSQEVVVYPVPPCNTGFQHLYQWITIGHPKAPDSGIGIDEPIAFHFDSKHYQCVTGEDSEGKDTVWEHPDKTGRMIKDTTPKCPPHKCGKVRECQCCLDADWVIPSDRAKVPVCNFVPGSSWKVLLEGPYQYGEGCKDKLIGKRPWHDSDGAVYDCNWYAGQKGACAKYGHGWSLDGFTANTACCTCKK